MMCCLGRRLDVCDDFEVMGGIPTTILKDGKFRVSKSVFSKDGSRLAVNIQKRCIRVYDAWNNFALISSFDNKIVDFMWFYEDGNAEMGMVCFNRMVHTIRIEQHEGCASEATGSLETSGNVIKLLESRRIPHPDKKTHFAQNQTMINQREVWIGEEVPCENGTILVTRILDRMQIAQIQIRCGLGASRYAIRMSLYQRALMAIPYSTNENEGEDEGINLKTCKTWVCLDIRFENGGQVDPRHAELVGKGTSWSQGGKFITLFKIDRDGSHLLKLYALEELRKMRQQICQPSASISLGHGVLTLVTTTLHRNLDVGAPVENNNPKSFPLIAITIARSFGSSCIVWDSYSNEIVKEIDLTINKYDCAYNPKDKVVVSPDKQWIGVFCAKSKTVGIFSLASSALVWSHQLVDVATNQMCCPNFDPLTTSFVCETVNSIFLFSPPCFLDKDIFSGNNFLEHLGNTFFSSDALLVAHQHKLFAKHIDYGLYFYFLPKLYRKHFVDATSMASSPQFAVLTYLEKRYFVFVGEQEQIWNEKFPDYLKRRNGGGNEPFEGTEISIDPKTPQCDFQDRNFIHLFAYPTKKEGKDAIALFYIRNALSALFVDVAESDKQRIVRFGEGEWFSIKQTKDRCHVVCIMGNGVMKIDLRQQVVLFNVSYKCDLSRWVHCFRYFTNCWNEHFVAKLYGIDNDLANHMSKASRNYGLCDVSDDCQSILVGWDMKKQNKVVLSSSMSDEDVVGMKSQMDALVPCWALTNNLKKVAFIELSTDKDCLVAICAFNDENKVFHRYDSKRWNYVQSLHLQNLDLKGFSFSLELEPSTGCLWIRSLSSREDGRTLLALSLGPHLMNDCIPSLSMFGYPSRSIRISDLKQIVSRYGPSSINMKFGNISNFHCAHKSQDQMQISNFQDLSLEYGYKMEMVYSNIGHLEEDLLKTAIESGNSDFISCSLSLVGKQLTTFYEGSKSIERYFSSLWLGHQNLLKPLLIENSLCWNVCKGEVRSDIFTRDTYLGARVGTSDTIAEWKNEKEKSCLCHDLDVFAKTKFRDARGQPTKAPARIKFFCMDNVCKVGSRGILRFLLIQQAESHIFKTEIVKWAIIWKWENIWKDQCRKEFIHYGVFIILFSAYTLTVGYWSDDIHKDLLIKIIISVLLFASSFLGSQMLIDEYVQLHAYLKDGQKIFPSNQWWGVQSYFNSKWNFIDLGTYILLLNVIPHLHVLSLFSCSYIPYLIGFIAVENILVWIKVCYFAQTNRQTGALVLLIENVIEDCLPFLFLAFVVLIGYSFAFFTLFKYKLSSHSSSEVDLDEERRHVMHESYGSPFKAMLTLFYAMIGTFEPEIYSLSGKFSYLIPLLFVSYLSTQLIVMLNMLIAIMGDTFDKVKSTEEEQLLMGRARYMDACEASLSRNKIEEMEKKIGKYLYVIYPIDENLNDNKKEWQGRTETIKMGMRSLLRTNKVDVAKTIEEFATHMQQQRESREEDLRIIRDENKESFRRLQEWMTQILNAMQEENKARLESMGQDLARTNTESLDKLQSESMRDASPFHQMLQEMGSWKTTFEDTIETGIHNIEDRLASIETHIRGETSGQVDPSIFGDNDQEAA